MITKIGGSGRAGDDRRPATNTHDGKKIARPAAPSTFAACDRVYIAFEGASSGLDAPMLVYTKWPDLIKVSPGTFPESVVADMTITKYGDGRWPPSMTRNHGILTSQSLS